MSRKLRIFISSTMKDLKNERFEVVKRIKEFNYEAVNAEGFTPDGSSSWPRLEKEIESSDIMILILGEKYGWIPDEGPKSELGISVTELEVGYARELGIPILPFLKKLDYDADSSSEDAKKRDRFREKVRHWKEGYFTTDFELASDLADSVGDTLMGVLADAFYDNRVRERSKIATESSIALNDGNNEDFKKGKPLVLPDELLISVRNRDAVLFAGSGVSISSGLPSAHAIAQRLALLIKEVDSSYTVNPTGATFAVIATDLAALRGHEFLEKAIKKIMNSPHGVIPSAAHKKAVVLFDQIFTTNYDSLFEDAVSLQCLPHSIITNEINGRIANKSIVKVHGSLNSPGSLLLVEKDVFTFDQTRQNLWQEMLDIMRKKTVIVVGSALHDPSIVRLFCEVGPLLNGYFVSPNIMMSTPERTKGFNLQCIEADADSFMDSVYELL